METDSFETDLRQALARRAAQVPGDAVERLQGQRYRPRTGGRARMAIAGLAGVAAVAAVAGIAISQPTSHQSSPKGSAPTAQLAAWTVTSQDGTVIVAIRQMNDVGALQAKLRAAGIPASVSIHGNPACTIYPASFTQIATALGIKGVSKIPSRTASAARLPHNRFVLRASALPSGAGVQLVQTGPDNVLASLVRVSPQCTGS